MTGTPERQPSHRLRLRDLPRTRPTEFEISPDAPERAAIAADLGIEGVRKLRFAGQLVPQGREDWEIQATLGATVVQSCVVTLAPVATRIDETLNRRLVADLPVPGAEVDEVEVPQEDVDALPETLDLGAVMTEALALALPLYPRAEGVEAASMQVTAPGVAPLTDEDAKPFAGLRDLRDRLIPRRRLRAAWPSQNGGCARTRFLYVPRFPRQRDWRGGRMRAHGALHGMKHGARTATGRRPRQTRG